MHPGLSAGSVKIRIMSEQPEIPMHRSLIPSLLISIALLGTAPSGFSDDTDPRVSLGLTDAERIEFLAEMRQMLASIQGIVAAIGIEDRDAIAAAARLSGNRMARATPAEVRAKLPQSFKALGGPTHLLFEEIALRADTDDMADLAVLTGNTLEQCLACHAQFRAN
jgi:hypothetical protein